MTNGLYRLDAFGLNNIWNRWRLQHGALDEPEIERKGARRRLFADDFYDGEAYALARRMFPRLEVEPYKRSNRNVRL